MRRKTTVSIFICLTIIFGMLPQFSIAVKAGTLTYDPVTTEYAILNSVNYKNSDFYMAYVKNTDLYNAVGKFNGLSRGSTYIRSDGVFKWSNFLVNSSNQLTNYGQIVDSGQLQVGISATMKNVLHRHGNFLYGADSLAFQWIDLVSGYKDQLLSGYSFNTSGTATKRMGDMEYIKVSFSDSMQIKTGVGRTFIDCNCGDCYISDITVAFADAQNPQISKVYTCDADGKAKDKIAANSTVYLRVVFDEPVRLSDNNQSNHSNIQANMQDNNANTFTGNLVILKDNYIMFEFTIPSDYTGNLTMTQVNISSLFGNFPLALVKDGNSINNQINTGVYNGPGYTTSTSLITDIAGNPLENRSAALTSPCYIDGEAPYVMSITKTGQMNNSDVKAALGSSDLDNSDNHAGMGDSITFTATFNEQLKINGNCYSTSQFWGMNATLNVLDATGNPVSVRAASMAQVSGGRDLQNGASKGMVTQITFAPFIVAAGMSCQDPDGKIKITSITPYDSSVMITDLCGNGYQDSNNPWDSLNTNAYILDVTPPVVSVNLTPLSDGSYTPISMTSSGTNITSFCLPIQISDSSSVDGLTGSFSWVNQESGGTNYSYQYAVLASSNAPLETDWKNGTTGMNHSFTQVSAGTYIHIRLLPDTKYDLTSTSVVVSARDYPGNSNKASFVLNYTADGIPPAASLTGTSRDALAGKLTATIQVTDKVGIASVEYLWVTDSSVPTAETLGWSNCIGSFNNADKITTVSAERTGITVSAPFTGELYIKAVDTAGNVSVSNIGTLSYDISAPDYSITYPQEISAGASLSVSGLEENSALVVLVEKPDSPGTYYASVIDSMDQYGDVMENRSYLLNPSCNDLYKWRKYTVSESNGLYSFTYLGGSDDYLIRIINDLYYGKLRITVLSGTAIVKTSSYTNEPGNRENGAFVYTTTGGGLTYLATAGTASYPVYAENITLNVAPGNVLYAAPDVTTGYPGYYSDNLYTSVYQADITSDVILDKRITVNNQYNPIWDIPFNPDDPADDVLSTLEGVKITVNITNSIVKEWGVSDIDFKNSYLSIRLNSGQQIGELIPLSPMANQTITLPAYDYPSGSYNIILTLTSRASGAVSYFHYGKPIFVDATSASSDFGFAGVLNQSGSSRHGINEDQYIYYGPIYGAVDAEGKPYTQYSAGSETIYIPVNSTFGSIESTIAYNRLFFTVDDVSITNLGGFYGEKAIKAWNATVGVPDSSKVLSSWLNAYDATENGSSRYSLYSAVFVDSADQVEGAYKPRSLPLIKNTLNTIAFQVMNANGIASEVRTVYIYPVDVPVSGNVTLTDTREFIKEGVLTFTPNPGQSMVNVSVLVHDYMTGETFDITHTYDMNSNTYTHILDKGGAHLYNLYTVDGMNNKTIFVERFWGLTDSGKPEIKSAVADVLDGATYMATISFHENTVFNKKDQMLNLHFDSAYMAALGLNHSVNADTGSYTGDRFELNLPMGNAYYLQTIWLASESNPYGIYRVDVERRDHDGTVVLYGVRKFDTTVPEGTMLNHTLTATFTDPFGYISDPVNIAMNVPNTKPAYTNGEYKEYSSGGGSTSYRGLVATFNTPVMVGKSIGTNSPTPYSTVKVSELPVFGDGSHLISFFDIFGTKWDQEINLVDEFGEYSLTIHLSESDYTKEAVTITITADHPNAASFTVYDSTDGGWTGLTGIFPKNFASFTLSRNSQMNIIMRTNNDPSRVDRMLYLVNILPEAPSATLNWYFEEFKSNTLPAGVTQTTGKVTVGYKTSRKVTPSDGTASVYTFSHADPATSYTFRYTDEAGNAGYITADLNSLGLTLKAPDVPVPDTVKPEYQINLYGLYDGISKPVGYYSSVSTTESLDSILSAAGFVQSYYFDIEVTEDSPYKIVLLEGATADSSGVTYDQTSQSIPGVTLRGRTITAANAVSFTAVIVDNAGNRNSFSMNLGEYLDNTAPTATIEKINTTLYEVTAYIKLEDISDGNVPTGEVTLISPGGLTKLNDVTSPYNGWFYITFKDNQSILLTFKDQCGNKASATITVDSIDTSIPSLSITWMPYYISPEGEAQYDIPSDRMTNTDVFATLVFDRPIRRIDTSISFDYAMTFTDVTDNSYDNLFTLVYESDTATVTFKENDVVLRLTITALNGKSITEYIFGPYIIDKIPPNITQIIQYSYNTGGTIPVSALIKLTPDEDVYMIGGKTPEKVFAQGEEIRFTVFEKGIYSYRFTDMAGNMRVVNVNVDQDMDRTIPVITIDKGPDDPTKNDVLVKVSMNEAGTIKISGITHPVAKDQVLTVNIANNGSYPVIGTDNAGNQNITTFVIGFIDKIKPEITFMRSASPIRQNSDPGDLTAILEDKSYLVSDNMSAPEKITVTYDKTFVKLGTPGTYPVLYTAVDETGNQGTATRFIKVYSEKDLEVLLNGQKTEREGTLVIITKQVTLSVTNPIGDEPYTVYIRSGLKTEGQMKTGTIIEPDENGVFTVPSNGFYTLYIVTQSRQTYITRIYVEIGG